MEKTWTAQNSNTQLTWETGYNRPMRNSPGKRRKGPPTGHKRLQLLSQQLHISFSRNSDILQGSHASDRDKAKSTHRNQTPIHGSADRGHGNSRSIRSSRQHKWRRERAVLRSTHKRNATNQGRAPTHPNDPDRGPQRTHTRMVFWQNKQKWKNDRTPRKMQ